MLKTNPFRRLPFLANRDLNRGWPSEIPALMLGRVFLVKADLSYTELRGLNLEKAQLQGTNFAGADLRVARFYDAQLQGTNFFLANLRKANLSGADLRPFGGKATDLRRADLHGAQLRLCYLQRTLAEGASLVGTELDYAKLYLMKIDQETDMGNSNWWMTDFEKDKEVDNHLLEELFRRYGGKVPPRNLGLMDPSVRKFMEANDL